MIMKNTIDKKIKSPARQFAQLISALFIMLGFSVFVSAQPANSYVFSTSAGVTLETLTSPTQILNSGLDDSQSGIRLIGFTFNFGGTAYTQFSASSNGLMRLGAATVATTFGNNIGTGTFPQLCPWWDDTHTASDGGIFMQVLGSAPNRKLVVEWHVRNLAESSPGTYTKTYQAWLFESSDVIQYVYGSMTNGNSSGTGPGASVGIATASGVLSCVNSTTLHTNQTTTFNNLQTPPGEGRAYTFSPPSGPPPPANDVCGASVLLICGQTVTGTTINSTFSAAEANFGTCAPYSSGDVWYQIIGNGLTMTADLCSGTSYDSYMAVYSGSCGALTCVSSNDDNCGLQSQVSWLSVNGTTYFIRIGGFSSETGNFTLAVNCVSSIPNDFCTGAIPVSCGQTVSGTTVGAAADVAPFCGTSDGTGGGVWYSLVGDGSLVTVTTCNPGSDYDTKLRVFTGTCGSLICETGNDDFSCSFSGLRSSVTFSSVVGTTYYILVHGFSTAQGNFEVSVSCASPPPNDICSNAITVTCPQTVSGSTTLAGPDVAPVCGTTDGTGGGVWYRFVGTGQTVRMHTCNAATNYDTKIRVYTGTCGSLVCETGNDDFACSFSGLRSQVVFSSVLGTDYFILVHGFSTAVGDFELTVECAGPCVVGTASANLAVACGAVLNGVYELSLDNWSGDLQWQEEFPFGTSTWVNIGGATFSPVVLNIPNAGPRRFRAEVSGFCTGGPVHSNNVDFLLDDPAAPTNPIGISGCGSAAGDISVTPAGSFEVRWYDAASGGTLLGTGSTLSGISVTTSTDYYATSYNAATDCESSTRTKVTAIVNPFPDINLTNSNPVICNPGVAPNSSALSANVNNGGPGNAVFTNGTLISIPAVGTSGIAGPYPSTIVISGLPSSTPVQSVTLTGLSHTFLNDIDMVLVSPTGIPVVIMSDVGGFGPGVSGATFTLQDGAPAIPASSIPSSGTYSPTNSGATDTYVAPGPGSLTQATPTLASFTGDPNGAWSLYIVDDVGGDAGTLNSWSITFLGGQSFSFTWTPTTGLSGTTSGTISGSDASLVTAQPSDDQTYTVTMTNIQTGCSSTASTSITVNKAPDIVSLQSATLNGGVATPFPPLPQFLDIPEFTEINSCDKVVNYTLDINGTPDPAEQVGGLTYSFTGATSGSGDGTGGGSAFGRDIPTGRTTVTVNATNVCGSQSKVFRVTVSDNVAPVITPIPVPVTNTNGGECASLVQLVQPDFNNGGLFDNCPNASIIFAGRSDGRSQFEPYFAGITTVTWQATDASANTSTATQEIEVVNFKPEITSFVSNSGNIIFANQSTTFTATFDDEDGGGTHTVKFYRDKNDAVPASTRILGPDCMQLCDGIRSYSVTSEEIFFATSMVSEPKVEVLDGCNTAADQQPGVSTIQYFAVAVPGQQFTTAGGHFTMPTGGIPSAFEGMRVNFGNVVKKATNGNSFKGQLEMNIHFADQTDWRVHTDNGTNQDITWDYLTIGGCSLATFRGSVRLNGQTGYKVLVQQSDKDRNPSTSNFIRVKVTTNSGALIFDTQPGLTEALTSGNGGAAAIITALDGGAIKVQPSAQQNQSCTLRMEEGSLERDALQNIPNPFSGQTEIRFSVPQDGQYTLKVYNYLGQEVTTLFQGEASTGTRYSVMFDGSHHESGIYTYSLTGANVSETRRMNLVW